MQAACDLFAFMHSGTAAGAVKPMDPIAFKARPSNGSALATFMMSRATVMPLAQDEYTAAAVSASSNACDPVTSGLHDNGRWRGKRSPWEVGRIREILSSS